MAVPAWFDYQVYRANKLADLQEQGYQYDAMSMVAAFEAAGFSNTPEGMYDHFEKYGMSENISPNALFDADYYYQAKAASFFNVADNQVTADQVKFIKDAFTKAGLSAWEHYTLYGMKEGIDPNANFSTDDYLEDKLALLNADETSTTTWTRDSMVDFFKSVGLNPVSHYFTYGKDEGLTYEPASHAGVRQELTLDTDNLTGTMGDAVVNADGDLVINQNYNDYFSADVRDGANTLQSTDTVNGLGGTDTLYATVNVDQIHILDINEGIINPTIIDVEEILIRSQIGEGDEKWGTEHVGSVIDADRIQLSNSVTLTIGSDNSRADLTIEDLRHYSNKTVVRFADADPTENFYVYFDPQNLKSDAADTSGNLNLTLIDLKNGDDGFPLKDQPYNGFAFTYSGSSEEIELYFRAEDEDLYKGNSANYDTLTTAFQHALEDFETANPDLAGKFTIFKGDPYTSHRTLDGIDYTANGNYIVITSKDGTVNAGDDSWILSTGRMPSSISIEAEATVGSATTCPLIKVDVELDNVGRVQWDDASPNCLPNDVIYGSNAGELVIGSMAYRGGVERMDVFVDEGSWLEGLSSTNDTLRMVTVAARDIDGDGTQGGELYLGTWDGDLDDVGNPDQWTWTDPAKFLSANGANQDTTGLKDVAVFDASDYSGEINIAARITDDSYDKYFKSVDGERYINKMYAPLASESYSGDFTYITGSADDVVNMTLNGEIASDVDFELNINTGKGDDLVAFRYEDMTLNQSLNQKQMRNVHINTQDGDDTVWFYDRAYLRDGSVDINAGAGADTVYANQHDFWGLSGGTNSADGVVLGPDNYNAVFVFNATDNERSIGVDTLDGATLNNDVLSGHGRSSYSFSDTITDAAKSLYVTVEFMGFKVAQEIDGFTVMSETDDAGNTTYTPQVSSNTTLSAEVINHAIIDAINKESSSLNGHSLSDILAAKDGAGHSLIIESKINGAIAKDDLTIDFELRGSDGKALGAFNTKGEVFSDMGTYYDTEYGYQTAAGADDYTGAVASIANSQVVVNGGSDNDLIALGVNNAQDVVVLGSNFGDDVVFDFESGVDKINVKGLGIDKIHKVNDFDELNSKGVFVGTTSDISSKAINKLASDGNLRFDDGVSQGAKSLLVLHEADDDTYAFVLATKTTSSTSAAEVNAKVSILGTMTFDDTTADLTYDDLTTGSALV
ncbi:MAG: hypothetical protein IJU76_07630 [Desulfovibrionaceae bacterium]|nr:hypothetical protein [Desulfovibrionaceae bacterium]